MVFFLPSQCSVSQAKNLIPSLFISFCADLQLICIYLEMDNEDFGRPVANCFGVTRDEPKVLAYTGNNTQEIMMGKNCSWMLK
ncbi:hypothetical protein SLE2022_285160 [Rubroshorea leprosula]